MILTQEAITQAWRGCMYREPTEGDNLYVTSAKLCFRFEGGRWKVKARRMRKVIVEVIEDFAENVDSVLFFDKEET